MSISSMSFLSVGDGAATGRLFLFWFFLGSAQLRTSCHIKPRSCTITKIQCPFLRFLKDFLENFFLQYSRPRKCIGSREFQYIRDVFKGTLLLTLRGVEADLSFPPSRLLLHTVKRLFAQNYLIIWIFVELYMGPRNMQFIGEMERP